MRRFILSAVIAVIATAVYSQDGVPFNGLLLDIAGNPVKRAKVWVSRQKDRHAYSDKMGRFGLTDVQDSDTLNIKASKKTYSIFLGGRKSIRVIIADEGISSAKEDAEIADLGYGYVKRREITGSSSHITGDELVKTGCTDIMMALRGKVPGLQISSNPGAGTTNAMIRGRSSFTLSSQPLFILDGIEVSSFSSVSIYDVDYVEVLKDASIYGSRGANGVIIVKTKRGK